MADEYKRTLYDMISEMYRDNYEAVGSSAAPKLSPYWGLSVFNPSGGPMMGAGWSEKDFEGQGMSEEEMDEELEGIFRTEKRFNKYNQQDLDFFKSQSKLAHEHIMKKSALDNVDIRDIIEFLHNVPNRKK
tara:strand:- start:796 stop:1188 length:393 start_codon:yes stop_codon:yes gene_type:complete